MAVTDTAETRPLELWGGHECTVNRVGDQWFDQTVRTGHEHRPEDLDRFAEMGIKALRYPVLWERVSPERPDRHDWRWSDERLHRIRDLGVRPIAGLTHHGSGPKYTSMVEDSFATGLALHAAAVAERYDWVEAYTPVNEPLTTSRFSALYGHWYPHLRDEAAWWLALLNQIDATRLAMRAIRRVNPAAQLIQTEDLGHTLSTPELASQAEFENQRRWLTWDLLTGRVTPGHYFWRRLESLGLADRARAIADDPCPPDVVGVNHYLTSERFLDHRLPRYPEHTHGDNGQQRYADVEAVRVADPGPLGLERLLEQTWARYGLPMAVTESHNGCTREEQMRWVHEAWESAHRLRRRGVPIQAVTAWALLGGYDWNRLLTAAVGEYEPGPFDLRSADGAPRPTAIVSTLRTLATGEGEPSPVLGQPGWWRREIRYVYPRVRPAQKLGGVPTAELDETRPPLLITGATGTLGRAFAHACDVRGIPYRLTDRRTLALDDPASVRAALKSLQPWAVINTAGWVRVDEAEQDPDGCIRANADGAANLAEACAETDTPFLTFSSDLVFDGRRDRPYLESDAPSPLNVYGRSKAEAERRVLLAGGRPLVVRTAAFFSPYDPHNFAVWVGRELAAGRPVRAASDCVVSPTYVPDLVSTSLNHLIDGETGLRHLANAGALSWAEFAIRVAGALGLDPAGVQPTPAKDMGWPAERPAYAALGTSFGQRMRSFDAALQTFAEHARSEFAPDKGEGRAAKRGSGLRGDRATPAATG
ncbi:MAG: sugar nucleotide-binding protein [Proteobacteria bacterium]|nr:sugar nucleotide-binding protein [Pseudomonadota bacterium]